LQIFRLRVTLQYVKVCDMQTDPTVWTTDQLEAASKLWQAGAPAREIAAAVGAFSPAAVIARMWRIGCRRPQTGLRGQFFEPLFEAWPLPPAPPVAIARTPRLWLARADGECAFPVDGEGWRTRSCCNPCGAEVYCPAHAALMRRPRA
jgi:hypothetical protein